MWPVFDRVNVDDNIAAAYETQYPVLAADHSLHEHWGEMIGRGPESMQGFINGLKGKVAEFNAKDVLEAKGYTNVRLAPIPNQEGLDNQCSQPGRPACVHSGQDRYVIFSQRRPGPYARGPPRPTLRFRHRDSR